MVRRSSASGLGCSHHRTTASDACALGLPLGSRNSTILRPPNNERLAPACASSLQSKERPGS
jgi:hypothetical protein